MLIRQKLRARHDNIVGSAAAPLGLIRAFGRWTGADICAYSRRLSDMTRASRIGSHNSHESDKGDEKRRELDKHDVVCLTG